jgi:hypothetical protein
MLYLRTASGGFINSTVVVGLAPQHGEGGKRQFVGMILKAETSEMTKAELRPDSLYNL